MRKLIVASLVTLDGYVAGPGGNVMVLPIDHFFDAHKLERLRHADTLLLGATTYVGLNSYWPSVARDRASARRSSTTRRSPRCTVRPGSATTSWPRSSSPTR